MIPARFRDFLYRSVFNRAVFKRTDARRRNLKQRFSTETLERKALLTTFFVTNTDDAGAGSLRDAVAAAEVSTVDDNDSIEFNLAPGSTILLTSGQIEITDNLFFNGPGSDALTIDAGGNSRIFDIVEGEDEFLEVGIGGMTLTNGSADDGGAVRNSFASVFMADVVLSNNTASQRGGAIYTEGESFGYGGPLASLYLDDVDITGNSAVDGGGIYNDNDHVELENDSTVTGNMASNNGGGIYTLGQGGGIEVGTLFVYDGSTISDNVAGNDGGGIYNENDHVELWNGASLNNNVAGNRGGGAYTFATGQFGPGESFYVTDSEIAGNTAVHGGGIFNEGDFVRLFRATVRDNTAAGATDGSASSDGLGGGIYHMAIEIIQGESSFLSGDLDVDQSTISNNVAIAGSDSGVGADGYGGGGSVRRHCQ